MRATKRPLGETVTEHNCDAPARQMTAARWIGKGRHRHIKMRHRKKTSYRRTEDLFVAHCVITIAEISLGLLIVSWNIGLLGIRVGEAAVPGPGTTTQTQPDVVWETRGGGRAQLREAHSDVPLCMLQHIEKTSREQTHGHANEDRQCLFADGGGRGSQKTARSDVPFSIPRHTALDEEADEPDMGHECLSEGDVEEALSSDSDTALQAQSNDEKRNFRVSRSGGRASQKSQSNFPLLPPDLRATEQGACFLPTDHRHTASDDARQDPSHTPLGWKFCTMNMTAFSTQHLAIFELGCHVCGDAPHGSRTFLGLRGHERDKLEHRFWAAVGSSAIGLGSEARWRCDCGPGVEFQKAPLVSAQEKALHDTGRCVRALVAYGKDDRVVHVVSVCGHTGA